MIYLVLLLWSAGDVRGEPGAVTFYFVGCVLWIFLSQEACGILGVSLPVDVVRRKNGGAGFALAGLTIGATCCAAGANVGDGPGPAAVLVCALLSTVTLFLLWILLAKCADAAEAITVERDYGAGLRAGGWLAGTGAVLGASVAGDWVSMAATWRDFVRFGWPALAASILFITFEQRLSRRALRQRLSVFVSASLAFALVIAGASYALWVTKH